MLREATIYRDVPLRVAAFPSREGDKVKLVAIGELVEPSTKLAAAVIGVYDLKGRLAAQVHRDARMRWGPLHSRSPCRVAPGRYRLRLAVTDTSGRGGTADYDVDADSIPGRCAQAERAACSDRTPAASSPLLEFGSEPSAVATFERAMENRQRSCR